MGKRFEEWAEKNMLPIMHKSNFQNNLSKETINKIFRGYMKFLNFTFKLITFLTISTTFLWFFPIYLNLGWDRTITIILLGILLQLRYGKITVINEEKSTTPKNIKENNKEI